MIASTVTAPPPEKPVTTIRLGRPGPFFVTRLARFLISRSPVRLRRVASGKVPAPRGDAILLNIAIAYAKRAANAERRGLGEDNTSRHYLTAAHPGRVWKAKHVASSVASDC